MFNVALIGAGRVGGIRARVVRNCLEAELKVIADVHIERARELTAKREAKAVSDWRDAISFPSTDIVIIATPTNMHKEIALAALEAGKHVLCEKPLARSVDDARDMVDAAVRAGRMLWTGFNYRYMAHIQKAKELIEAGRLGPLYFLRSRYGHGGRPGYEKDWCTDADLSGGGVLLEQGIHILDQVRFLLGEPTEILAQVRRYFWNFPAVEDNCFCMLKINRGQIAQIHVSWTQWVNILQLEIFGRDGYLQLDGRDGHYGSQRLIWGKRNPDHSRPEEEIFDFAVKDDSWEREWADFLQAIREQRNPMPQALSGLRTQLLVAAAYQSAKEETWVGLCHDK